MISCCCSFLCEARVIPVDNGSSDLLSVVLEETGGLGVDIIIDSGGKNIFLFELLFSFFTLIGVCLSSAPYCFFFFYMCVVRLQEDDESEEKKFLPHKHDIISVLGVGGHWVTSHQDLQVSQCQTQQLHHKRITLKCLFYNILAFLFKRINRIHIQNKIVA